jgi:hypothetical protein
MQKLIFFTTIFLFFVVFSAQTQAQKGSNSEGFIINANGDTLRGRFDFSKPGAATNATLRVNFTDEKTGSSKQYAPFQIKGWQLNRDSCYNEAKVLRIKDDENGYGVFMRRLNQQGEIICYKYVDIGGQMPLTVYYLEKEQKLTTVNMGGKFYKQLALFFQDSKELSENIAAKKYKGNKEKALINIVNAYNIWFEDQWK